MFIVVILLTWYLSLDDLTPVTVIIVNSFFSGNYGLEVTLETLKDFHRRRLQVLSEAGADIIAFETIPSKIEAQVLFDTYISRSGFSLSCSPAATF